MAASGVSPLRIAVCDDAIAYPVAVRVYASRMPAVELAGVFRTRRDLFDGVAAAAVDVLLLDVRLPEGDSDAGVIEQVRALSPATRILLISNLMADELAVVARDAGADGWRSKATDIQLLLADLAAGR